MDGGASVNSQYEITSPLFNEIKIQLNTKYYQGKNFVIKTINNLPENNYIQGAELNGQNWTKFCFPHEIFAKGGTLKLALGKQPNKNWGINE